MSVMCIAFNGTTAMGQFLGDTIVSIKAAYLMARAVPCSKYILTLSRKGELNFLWQKFIDTFNCSVFYDQFDAGNMDVRFAHWDKWRRERCIEVNPGEVWRFDHYRELYRRIDGGMRQSALCGSERGLGRKNIFEYLYFGQEDKPEECVGGDSFGGDLIYYKLAPPEWDVFVSPEAKCQGNSVFTMEFWDKVIRKLVAAGVKVTCNNRGPFAEDLTGDHYHRIFPPFRDLPEEVCKHRLVCCGNTGIGWVAGATGVPLLAMQPPDSNMQDYRYEWCGVKSLVEFVETPDVDYVVRRVQEELEKKTVFTTGCYDVMHVGHIRHLEESRSMGSRLVVALNSDASIRKLKGDARPIQKQEDRAAILKALRCVDEVRIFDGDDALPVIEELRPAIITNGSDHKLHEIIGKSFVESYGGRAVVTNGDRDATTTGIVRKIEARAMTRQDVAMAVQAASPLSPSPPSRLRLLAEEFLSVVHLPGAVADLGTYKGAAGLILRRLAPEKELHLFDTWAGNPHNDELCHHKAGEWPADIDDCRRAVGSSPRTHWHKGIFPRTAEEADLGRFCFVYVDMDTYQATKAAIAFFWPRLVEGGKMMFDDVPWEPCAGVEKAVNEAFTLEQQRRIADQHSCVVTK